MKSLVFHSIGCLIGLAFGVSVWAEPLLEGRVRLSSGQPAAGVQVRLFDLTDLRRSVGTTTDETGHFALPLRTFSTATAVPTDFALGQNYPNPFNPSTLIPYQLPTAGHVRLEVFNLLGQRVATLVDAERSAGTHTAQWDATDASGRAVGAGVYIYRLSSGGHTVSRRMVLVDGQAGIPAAGAAPGSGWSSAVEGVVEAEAGVYGLTVSGAGVVAYVDPAFRVGLDAVDLVVEEHGGSPRMKRTAAGVLGDVDSNGRVNLADLLLVMLYSMDSSITLPNNGDISLGDVNGDGWVDIADAVLLVQYLSDPFDPELPPGIGKADGSSDRAALVALYEATDGENWTNNTNWLSDKPLGEWSGVTTDDSGRVTVLYLTHNQLSGTLPSELGNLTNLQWLMLVSNQLSGTLPASLGALPNLQSLDLDTNQLSGTLPAWLGSLTNLQSLSLSRNELSGEIPSELGNLTNLEWLALIDNELSGEIPSELGNLTNLQDLWLSDNELSGEIPSELGNLTNLQSLSLSDNELSGEIPSELGNLTNLQSLSLSDNELSGEIPSELGNLTNLFRLWLSANELSGEIPSELGSLTNLLELKLDNNVALSGPLPSSFTLLVNLVWLDLSNTQLCAPTDDAFQAWLQGGGSEEGVVNCE